MACIFGVRIKRVPLNYFMKTSILQTFSLTAFQCVKNAVYLAINVSFKTLYLF